MEWTFDQLRQLAKDAGVTFERAQTVTPAPQNTPWHDTLNFVLSGTFGGVSFKLKDTYFTGNGPGELLRLWATVGGYDLRELVSYDDYNGTLDTLKLLLGSADCQKVVKGGGLSKLRDTAWAAVVKAVVAEGGNGETGGGYGQEAKLPGYGKVQERFDHQGSDPAVELTLTRNKHDFATVRVSLLNDDYEAKAKEVVDALLAEKEDRKKKKKNTPLHERLNELKVSPTVEDGKVTELVDENNESLRVAELESLGLDPDDLGSIEEHPEGADRGGYLPTVRSADRGDAQYDECDGQWQ